ncbi:MAG: PrsW family intramembrane metalloprotease [Methanomassiliicoccales archaeon]|nr:PrsW family intramembrane metalloprotease [Methanomassiliicoccales archaeon]
MALDLISLAVLVVIAIVPAVIYLIWVRNTETCRREPYSALIGVMVYGGTFAVAAAVILETLAQMALTLPGSPLSRGFGIFGPFDPTLEALILAVIIAPVVEELVKATGVFTVHGRLNEIEDGIIYGAAAGLGFAVTENVLYFVVAYSEGAEVLILTIAIRSVTSMVLHLSATSISGYGISRSRVLGARGRSAGWLRYVGIAIVLHAAFNLFASLGDIFPQNADILSIVGLIIVFVLANTAFGIMRRRIKELDLSVPCPDVRP